MRNIPRIFKTFHMKDVSSDYFEGADVEIVISDDDNRNDDFLYLAVSNKLQLEIVATAKIENGKALFKDMGRDIVYFPVYFLDGNIIPINNPIYLGQNGNIKELNNENSKKGTLNLTRKYFNRERFNKANELLKDAVVYGSNTPNFKDSVLLCSVDVDLMGMKPHTMNVVNNGRFKYVRIWITTYAMLSEFYVKTTPKQLIPKIYYDKQDSHYIPTTSCLIDGKYDAVSFIRYKINLDYKNEPTYIQYDFPKPVGIESVTICGWNDDNNVETGLDYELFYWLDGQWHSAKEQVATSDVLTYHDIPIGTVYYLKCHSEGKEERIFLYDDIVGTQHFK